MRGILVLGASPAADVPAVATAVAGAARAAGLTQRVHIPVAAGNHDALERLAESAAAELDHIAPLRFPAAAAPLVAARHHHSETLEPPALLAALQRGGDAEDVLIVALPATGPLSPLTPRYAVRDFARELELPLVLAIQAGTDALPGGRLAAETLRGAGLALAALVLTGWPDPPDRTARDERALLGELSGCAVYWLPDPDAARRWPLEEWLSAQSRGAPASGVPAPQAAVLLEPYTEWEPTPQGDPRSTPRPRIMEAIAAIVAAEGPITANRAFALYNRAAGGKKLTTIARAPLSSALHWLAKQQQIALVTRTEIPWQDDDVARALDAPAVRVRELGPRALDEVPLDEIAELMRRLRDARGTADPQTLKRGVLDSYGLTRMTAKADAYLELALGLLEG